MKMVRLHNPQKKVSFLQSNHRKRHRPMPSSNIAVNSFELVGFRDQDNDMAAGSLLSGYLADSEGAPLLPAAAVLRTSGMHVKIPKVPKVCQKTKWRMSSHHLKRRRRRAEHLIMHNEYSWIQRLYSSTPFSTSFVGKIITARDDFDVVVDQAIRRERRLSHSPCRRHCQDDEKFRIRITAAKLNDKESSSLDDQAEDEVYQEEAEFSSLVSIVSGLLKESHEVQETYKSYSSCHAGDQTSMTRTAATS